MLSKIAFRAACMAALLFLFSCGGGDDDGRRLGEYIVGTWQRGWNEGDVIIEGSTDIVPENFSYDKFLFQDDGTYNGMVRKGSFKTWGFDGSLIFEGTYQCDNNNMKLEFRDSGGTDRKLLAQVVSFTEETVWLRYTDEQHGVTVTFIIRKGYSSSSMIDLR